MVNNLLRAFTQSRDGNVWIGTDEGVSRWTGQGFKNYQMRDGLCYFSTRSLMQDRDGDIWIGTDRGLSRLHLDKFESDAVTEALKSENGLAIHQDPNGGLWFGTRNGGFYLFPAGRLSHLSTPHRPPTNNI